MAGSSVIYVNFSPYDNTGRTLDYLIENFSFVAHFSFDHLRLRNNRGAHLFIYQNGKLDGKIPLSGLKTHPILLFPSLPFVAIAMLIETLWYSFLIKKQMGIIDTYLTVNAFPAVVGIILRKFGIVQRTIFWVWDYYPTNYPDWRMRVVRKTYYYFDRIALKLSNKVVFLNEFLRKSRDNQGFVHNGNNFKTIPIGTNPSKNFMRKLEIVGHMGLIKESQGLDLLFENLEDFFKAFPKVKIEIIGTGPEEEKYKKMAVKFSNNIIFYGFMESPEKIDQLVKRWKVGIATYVPTKWSEHYWGDPSKIKAYIANGVPVVTTDVPEFAREIAKEKAGIVISYNKDEFFKAISKINKQNIKYSKKAYLLSKKFYYKRLYKELLS